MSSQIIELKKQLVEVTKHKGRKRKRIQYGGILEYSTAVLYIATTASTASQPSKKACSGGGDKQALPAQRRCRNCGETGYNTRTCKKDEEVAFKSNASVSYASSLVSCE